MGSCCTASWDFRLVPTENFQGSLTCDNFQFYSCSDVPNQVAPILILNPRTAGKNACSRASVQVSKDTAVTESTRIELRVEMFNVWNHTQFNNPTGNFNSGLFGRVAQARDPRIPDDSRRGAKIWHDCCA